MESSLAEDYQTRHVFEDMLKLCDLNGVVDMTAEAIARRTNVPLDIVKRGIAELEKPDHKSRNPENQGKRIVRLDDHRDWGWLIVNYDYYRKLASEDQRREKTALRVRRFREKNKPVAQRSAHVAPCNEPVAHTNASNAMQREMEKHKQKQSGERERAGALIIPASERPDGIALPLSEVIAYGASYEIPEEICSEWFEHIRRQKTVNWKSSLRGAYSRVLEGRSSVLRDFQ